MTQTWKLDRTKQCANCPWRVDSDPHAINNYSLLQHQTLESTIAKDTNLNLAVKAMACHESSEAHSTHCIGWLHQQLNDGNNLGLRLSMANCENADRIEVVGPQHQIFIDTLPESKPKFVYFSFAVLDDATSQSIEPIEQVAVVSGSILGTTTEAAARIKLAVAEWLATDEGFEVLAEVEGIFTVFELEDFYTPQLEDMLCERGIIDLQIDVHAVTTECNLLA